jgi:hypothetical protein
VAFRQFVGVRTAAEWGKATVPTLRKWLEEGT